MANAVNDGPMLWGGFGTCRLEIVVNNALSFDAYESLSARDTCRGPGGSIPIELCVHPRGYGEAAVTHVSSFIGVVVSELCVEEGQHPWEVHAKEFWIEIVNWTDADQSIVHRLRHCTFTSEDPWYGTEKVLEVARLSKQSGWLGPGDTLWVRGGMEVTSTTMSWSSICTLPTLPPEELELVVVPTVANRRSSAHRETAGKNDGGIRWELTVVTPANFASLMPMRAFVEVWPPSAVCGGTTHNAKYNIKFLNWLRPEKSEHISGIVELRVPFVESMMFPRRMHGKLSGNFDIEFPLLEVSLQSHDLGWVGPGGALWMRASLELVTPLQHTFRFMPRDVVLALSSLPRMQDLRKTSTDSLVTKAIELSPSSIGTYNTEYCVVSHYWNALGQPDPEGTQLAALKRHLVANPSIEYVWLDFCCLPQRDSRTGRRNQDEETEFQDGLKHIHLLFLNVGVLILYDLHFVGRFWPQWEAWLAMHTPSAAGLQLSEPGLQQRWAIIDLKGDGKTEGDGSYLTWWVRQYSSQEKVFEYLARDDVTVTNSSDKQAQLEVLRTINEDVKAVLG